MNDSRHANAQSTEAARVHITTNPATHCVHLHSNLPAAVVQRSALLQGISESSGESSLPVNQSDIFGWLHVVTRRNDDVADSLYRLGVLPDMSMQASVLSVRTPGTLSFQLIMYDANA